MAVPQQIEYEIADYCPPLDKGRYTEDEYFALDDLSRVRLEFVPNGPPGLSGTQLGIIRAMSGGTADHARVIANLIYALENALRGAGNRFCRVFSSDLKVHNIDGRNTFPDVSVVCGTLNHHRGRRDSITNPILVAEVLSPSTQANDLTDKRQSYQTIPTLQHYLLIAADKAHVESYTRGDDGWQFATFSLDNADSQIPLPGLGVALALSDLYALVELESGETL